MCNYRRKNKVSFIILLLNFFINIIPLVLPWFAFLGYVDIAPQYGIITFSIISGFGILAIIYNEIVPKLKLYSK